MEHAPGGRVDLVNSAVGDLVQVLAVERGPAIGADLDRTHRFAAGRIECVELTIAGEPDLPAIEGHAVDTVDAFERAVFTKDFCACLFHAGFLVGWVSPA